jgi:predicted Zn-dependent peptidase
MRVVMETIPTSRSVTFGIWVKTGSRFEKESDNGISHFIEHMLFKGTEKYSPQDIAIIFDGIGGNVNAFTSKEYTCYYAKVLDQHLPIAVEVLSDMFFHSVFDSEELEREKNVIFEEISMYDDTPDDLVHDLVAMAAYDKHPLAYPILGTETNLQQMTSSNLKAYMKEYYHIENTVISLVGNLDDTVLELLEKHFGSFENHGSESIAKTPIFQGGSVIREKKTEQNHICLSLPGCSLEDENLYAMVILNNLVGGGMSSRLFQEIREKRGLAYSIFSYHSAHMDSGLFTIYAGTAPKQTEEVMKVMMDLLSDVANHGLTDVELKRGKEQLKGSLILSLESTSSRMNRLGKNELMLGKHYSLDEIIQRIEAVQLNQIKKLSSDLFSHPFALAMVGNPKKSIREMRRDQLAISRSN